MAPSMAEVRAQAGHLGDLPLTVLTAGATNRGELVEPIWQEMQRGLARLSDDSRHHIVADSGHFIQHDAPAAVAAALHDAVARSRRWWATHR